jgi:hypothetical protein
MPSRRPCLGPGRFHLSEPGESRCAQHRLTKWASKAGTSMGSGWATLRRRVLTEEPRCRSCGANATTVDHIVARAFAAVTIERTWLRSAPRVTARRPRPTLSRADAAKLPDDWRRFGDRHSPISRSPRSAVTAGGAVVNLLYTLALIESRLALVASDWIPAWGSRTAMARIARVPLSTWSRPSVHPSTGLPSIYSPRGRSLEGSSSRRKMEPCAWRRRSPGDSQDRRFRCGSGRSDRSPRRWLGSLRHRRHPRLPSGRGSSQTDRKRGRKRTTAASPKMASACRVCGLIGDPGRQVCDECLPAVDRDRTDKLSNAGKAGLAAMRASNQDPAHSAAARTSEPRRHERRAPRCAPGNGSTGRATPGSTSARSCRGFRR